MTPEQATELLRLHRATLNRADEYNAGLSVLEMLLNVEKRLRKIRDELHSTRDNRKRLVRKHGAAKLKAMGLIR
jgi:hypothetical protein